MRVVLPKELCGVVVANRKLGKHEGRSARVGIVAKLCAFSRSFWLVTGAPKSRREVSSVAPHQRCPSLWDVVIAQFTAPRRN